MCEYGRQLSFHSWCLAVAVCSATFDRNDLKGEPGSPAADAALANISTLASALEPALDASGKAALCEKLKMAPQVVKKVVDTMWCKKLGFESFTEDGIALFQKLEDLGGVHINEWDSLLAQVCVAASFAQHSFAL